MWCVSVGYVWITCKCAYLYIQYESKVWTHFHSSEWYWYCIQYASSCLCRCVHMMTVFMPSCLHIHTQTCRFACQLFFSLILHYAASIHEWGVCLVFPPAFRCALLPGFCSPFPGLDTRLFFFHLSLTEEMISDWKRWGRNDKLIYPTSEPGFGEHLQTISVPSCPGCCQTVVSTTFYYSTKSAHKCLWLFEWDIQ